MKRTDFLKLIGLSALFPSIASPSAQHRKPIAQSSTNIDKPIVRAQEKDKAEQWRKEEPRNLLILPLYLNYDPNKLIGWIEVEREYLNDPDLIIAQGIKAAKPEIHHSHSVTQFALFHRKNLDPTPLSQKIRFLKPTENA